jgi:hypothetical protein
MSIISLKRLVLSLGITLTYLFAANQAFASVDDKYKHPYYIGVTGGYGWTTWGGLVPAKKNQNLALLLSTPKYVNESGALWGVFAGYEFIPNFALEAAYMHYPNARVVFDSSSLFAFNHDGTNDFSTRTEMVSLMGKLMLFIPTTDIRVYSSVGAAYVHRSDQMKDYWTASPTFGIGLNYLFSERVMGEFGANYTAGNGEAKLNPAESYFPFLYSVFLRVAYRF